MGKNRDDKKPRVSARLTKRPIGQIFIDGGFVNERDLEKALDEQRHSNELLGDILVKLGLVDKIELQAALSVQKDLATLDDSLKAAAGTRMLLGELLVRSGRITSEQLDEALKAQKKSGDMLGEVLIKAGLLDEKELHAALAFQQNQSTVRPAPVCFRLGEILIASGIITRGQLDEALGKQRATGKMLGETLIESGFAEPHHISFGLNLQKKLITAALVASMALAAVPDVQAVPRAGASTAKASMAVSVRVLPSMDMETVYQAAELVIRDADIKRGYVDSVMATQVRLKSNSDYMMLFEGSSDIFKEIRVSGIGDGEIILASGSGLVERPTQMGWVNMGLSYRFVLAEDAKPGTYSWPITIAMLPR